MTQAWVGFRARLPGNKYCSNYLCLYISLKYRKCMGSSNASNFTVFSKISDFFTVACALNCR